MINEKKGTGVVRRIDDLGRIVIPKEVRRTLHIREGDPLEIYTNSREEIIFKKYSAVGDILTYAERGIAVLSKALGLPVLISDQDRILSVAGVPKKEYLERRTTLQLENIIENRKTYSCINEEKKILYPVDGIDKKAYIAAPIITMGDVVGSVIVLMSEENGKEDFEKIEENIKIVKVAADFFGKQMED